VEFQRIKRLPPYVFSIIDGMKMEIGQFPSDWLLDSGPRIIHAGCSLDELTVQRRGCQTVAPPDL